MHVPAAYFHAVGYLRVPGIISPEECTGLRKIAGNLAAQRRSDQVESHVDRTRIDHVVSADPKILATASSDQLVDALEPIIGTNIELVENRHNHLSIYHTPARDRLHRDVLQWSRSILTVLIYLSNCTDLATATRVVPASHLWPSTGKPNNGGTWLDESSSYSILSHQAVLVPAQAGDAVLMHGQLYHAGAGASAAGPRIVLTLAYRSVDELSEEDPQYCRLIRGRRIYRGRGAVHA